MSKKIFNESNADLNQKTRTTELRSSQILPIKKRISYLILFFIGLIFSYPTLFPIGIMIACIFFFKKDNIKINLMGLFLLIYQIINIAVFAFLTLDMVGLY